MRETLDAWDRRVVRAAHANMESRALRRIVIAATFFGYGWNWFVLAPMALVHAWYPTVSRLGGALVAAWCTLTVLKLSFPRTRPFCAMSLHAWWGAPKSDSFPSGHAAGAFAVATFFACWLSPTTSPRDAAIVVTLGFIALAVAASRVFLAVHYPTDVIGGALVGATCAAIAAHVHL